MTRCKISYNCVNRLDCQCAILIAFNRFLTAFNRVESCAIELSTLQSYNTLF